MKKIFLLILFLLGHSLSAQNLDSLYNTYVGIRNSAARNIKLKYLTSADANYEKCAFGIANEIKLNINRFNIDQKLVLQKLLSRPSTDTSIVSPSGYFRIHFNKAVLPDYVPEAVRKNLSSDQLVSYKKLYLDSLAIAADSAYNFEINKLGYQVPPSDGVNGGDDKYDIYIQAISGYYGETQTDQTIGVNLYTSYILMDDSFTDTYTKRIDAARVTIAHEFHHAIQMGSYGLKEDDKGNLLDVFYHELTSTSMEEFVFNNVNDYYNYISYYMRNPGRSFASSTTWYDGYDVAIWNLFLASRFDIGIIKRSWEIMKQDRALNAISASIAEYGSSFKNEFAQFGLWLYFTGSRSIPNKYFKEAANYPLINPVLELNFVKSGTVADISSTPVSENILFFKDIVGSKIDTLAVVVSNCDLTNGVNNLNNKTDFTYKLFGQEGSGLRKIIDGYYSEIQSSGDVLLSEMDIFNNSPINNGGVTSKIIQYAYPQPYKYSQSNFIYFPVPEGETGNADVYIYSVDMKLVFNRNLRILPLENFVVQWNCIDDSGKKLGSGIYLFIIKSGDKTLKGKFAVIND